MPNKIKLSPSLLAADFGAFRDSAEALIEARVEYLHFDIMDGHFVPNLSFGAELVQALRPMTQIPFDTHLMIENPDRFIPGFAKAGASMLTVHPEVCYHLHRVIHQIKEEGAKTGVALNPATPIESIEWVLGDLDRVLVMTVNPGFGGQKFLPEVLSKIEALRKVEKERGLNFEIAVDGGIGPETAPQVIQAGADVLIAGTAVFQHAGGPKAGVEELRKVAEQAVSVK